MNVFTNEGYFKEQITRARRIRMAGIGALAVVFVVSILSITIGLPPQLVLLTYPFLLAGFPLMTIGKTRLTRLSRTPREDHLLNNELKWLNNKYALHHYVPVGGTVIKHLLVAPVGLIAIETRDIIGQVTCKGGTKGDHWRVRTGFLERFGGINPPLGNPSNDLNMALTKSKELLASTGKPDVPMKGFIVFVRNNDLELESCSYSAIPLNELKDTVKSILLDLGGDRADTTPISTMLTSEDRRRVNALLVPPKPAVPVKPATAQR